MSLTPRRAAFFDVDNTLVRGSTIYFLGRGMYQRGFFTKSDISRFVLANLRFRLTGTEKQDEINRFQKSAQDFIGGHNVSEIQAVAQEIYDEYVSPALWEGTIEIAQRHLNDGVEVWLVTAAPEDMATLIAKRLGFTGAIGSKAAIEDGHYTGAMNGPLLHGREINSKAVTQSPQYARSSASRATAASGSVTTAKATACERGRGNSLSTAALMMPSVPSAPINRFFRS